MNEIENSNEIEVGQKIYIPKFKNLSRKGNIDEIPA